MSIYYNQPLMRSSPRKIIVEPTVISSIPKARYGSTVSNVITIKDEEGIKTAGVVEYKGNVSQIRPSVYGAAIIKKKYSMGGTSCPYK